MSDSRRLSDIFTQRGAHNHAPLLPFAHCLVHLEVPVPLPLGDVQAELVPLQPLGFDQALEDVIAEDVAISSKLTVPARTNHSTEARL